MDEFGKDTQSERWQEALKRMEAIVDLAASDEVCNYMHHKRHRALGVLFRAYVAEYTAGLNAIAVPVKSPDADGWISVDDKLPEYTDMAVKSDGPGCFNYYDVLVACEDGTVESRKRLQDPAHPNVWAWAFGYERPLFWQPAPEPPAELRHDE